MSLASYGGRGEPKDFAWTYNTKYFMSTTQLKYRRDFDNINQDKWEKICNNHNKDEYKNGTIDKHTVSKHILFSEKVPEKNKLWDNINALSRHTS